MWGWLKRKELPNEREEALSVEERRTAESRTQLYTGLMESQKLMETVRQSLELMEPKK